jgi:hypothetical protein
MDYKEACAAIADICRKQVDADPAHGEFWSRQAEEWSARSRDEKAGAAVTHEVQQGRLVPKLGDLEKK